MKPLGLGSRNSVGVEQNGHATVCHFFTGTHNFFGGVHIFWGGTHKVHINGYTYFMFALPVSEVDVEAKAKEARAQQSGRLLGSYTCVRLG